MDNLLGGGPLEETVSPSYNTVPLNEEASGVQVTISDEDVQPAALLDRIGSAKVYLLSDSTQTRTAKRKRLDIEEDEDVEMDEDSVSRANALFLTGAPISHLPTARIFAYVTHFDAQPIGLEWVNDSSCVLVFESKTLARAAHRFLQKTSAEHMDEDGFVTAKPIPVTLWLPEDRISKSLGQGEGLRGTIKMRWAKNDDVKKKGAKKESEFYKKYGAGAGKDSDAPQKRRRDERSLLDASKLDDDLDAFLGNERRMSYSPPPTNQLSESRSLIERTSLPDSGVNLRHRISSAPRDSLTSRSSDPRRLHEGDEQGDSRWGQGRGRRNPRPQKTQKELDDELDAFLNEKD
ncbi:hypothetical protein J3R82DRAFT_3921 [Butyriboletus roseoflavus]|nr:hypothetical protein J3R82DRAFT_3921 [Butyriboletus roseoflavus]